MFVHERSYSRPVELGPYPLEALPRDSGLIDQESLLPPIHKEHYPASTKALANASNLYASYFEAFFRARCSPQKAPVPDSLQRRSIDLKGAVYFLDASHVWNMQNP